MTEIGGDVMPNLRKNLEINAFLQRNVSAHQLRWDAYNEDLKNNTDLQSHAFDTIVGTDVIFSIALVKPLLSTLRKMSHNGTNIYLCVQIRCSDAHALFLEKTTKYGFVCDDITEDLRNYEQCLFGLELDCKLFHLRKDKAKHEKRDRRFLYFDKRSTKTRCLKL